MDRLHFLISAYGNNYIPFLRVCLYSVREHQPHAKVTVCHDDLDEIEVQILKGCFENVTFTKVDSGLALVTDPAQRIPLCVRHLWAFLQQANTDTIIAFLDVDTLMVKSIDGLLPKDPFDVLLTWKCEPFVVNTGVLFLVRNESTLAFVKDWLSKTESLISDPDLLTRSRALHGGGNQSALLRLLNQRVICESFVFATPTYDLKVKVAPCLLLNETNSKPPDSGAAIFHLKSGWHNILLRGGGFTQWRTESNSSDLKEYWQERDRLALDAGWKAFVLAACAKHSSHLGVAADEHVDRGILNSEIHAIVSMLRAMGIDVLIESGRYLGKSTREICKGMEGTSCIIHSTELVRDSIAEQAEERLKDCSNLRLHYGDAAKVIPELLSHNPNAKVALLLDGPKGPEAFRIVSRAIAEHPNVLLAFIHDLRKHKPGMTGLNRVLINDYFDRVFFTDDEDYVERFQDLDRTCIRPGKWQPFHKGWRSIASYGPTLGVIGPTERDRHLARKRLAKANAEAMRKSVEAVPAEAKSLPLLYRLHDYGIYRTLKNYQIKALRLLSKPSASFPPTSRTNAPDTIEAKTACSSGATAPSTVPIGVERLVYCGLTDLSSMREAIASGNAVYVFEQDRQALATLAHDFRQAVNLFCFPFLPHELTASDNVAPHSSATRVQESLVHFLRQTDKPLRSLTVKGGDAGLTLVATLEREQLWNQIHALRIVPNSAEDRRRLASVLESDATGKRRDKVHVVTAVA